MEINCRFLGWMVDSRNIYQCIVEDTFISAKDQVIRNFKASKGAHWEGKTHNDVKHVRFFRTKMDHFPRGLQRHFPNFTSLFIVDCTLKEISRNDLKGLERLDELRIERCHLTSLPDDLFSEMPNLRTVSLEGNRIELTSSKFLKPLLGRKNVKISFAGNKNINAQFWPGEIGSLNSLEELMKLIDIKCIKPAVSTIHPAPVKLDPMVKEMWISGKFSDLTIIAGDKKFKVHKNILGMKNEVFAQIFEDQDEATEIKIPGFSADSVEALLKFIYTNEISTEVENAKEKLDIADKFKVGAMKLFYEKNICGQIDEDNALETFLFAHRFSSQLLKEKAFQQIALKIPELPHELMEDPENLKKLIDYRKGYEEILLKSKKISLSK